MEKKKLVDVHLLEGYGVVIRESLEGDNVLEVVINGEYAVDLYNDNKEWSCYDGVDGYGWYDSPSQAIKHYLYVTREIPAPADNFNHKDEIARHPYFTGIRVND